LKAEAKKTQQSRPATPAQKELPAKTQIPMKSYLPTALDTPKAAAATKVLTTSPRQAYVPSWWTSKPSGPKTAAAVKEDSEKGKKSSK